MGHITDILGYTADADTYCVACTFQIYGEDPYTAGAGGETGSTGRDEWHDREGNPIRPIFNDGSAVDGSDHGKCVCGECLAVIDQWCALCESGDHGTIDHGDPLVILDHGRRDEWQEIEERLAIARSLVTRESAGGDANLAYGFGEANHILRGIGIEFERFSRRREWLEAAERDGKLPVTQQHDGTPLTEYQRGMSVARFGTADECLAEEGAYDFLSESIRDISDALRDAGYLAMDDGDAGCWFVYDPILPH